ncbi:hypothetical protein BV25DRAFT_353452 [Artomyces pyxidatus]|uniref:Uncharacterized protein n=1 Tax=Artomyces pyxidatus TaxID=48021 RepID=A0ACB8T5H4_9AGAM|nr:hypothetical protein BV25DRAFT_353452 [Artomyces pyxidatus]
MGHDAGLLLHSRRSNSPLCGCHQCPSGHHRRLTASALPVVCRSYFAASYDVCDGSPRRVREVCGPSNLLGESVGHATADVHLRRECHSFWSRCYTTGLLRKHRQSKTPFQREEAVSEPEYMPQQYDTNSTGQRRGRR